MRIHLNSDSSSYVMFDTVLRTYSPRSPKARWEAERGEPLETHRTLSLESWHFLQVQIK